MNLEHAIKTLEEDLVGGVLNFRQTTDIRLALKILNKLIVNAKTLSL